MCALVNEVVREALYKNQFICHYHLLLLYAGPLVVVTQCQTLAAESSGHSGRHLSGTSSLGSGEVSKLNR